jgi:small subunit ribosomal protein S20
MPIKQQSKKALRQMQAHAERNMKVREDLKTLMKKVRQAIDKKEPKDKIEPLMKQIQKGLDKAAQKNVMKKNTAARKLSRLMKYNKIGGKVDKKIEKKQVAKQ